MPLRCVDEHGVTIEANACTGEEWKALRARARAERHLKMPCCPAQAVLKTSRLGTRFFAHKARSACDWKPETDVHLLLKQVTLETARDCGWEAQTEVGGSTPDGDRWTADVLAWKGEERIAVEIQWSGQTNQETWHRQRRYQQSGVEGVWLLRQPGFPISEELPAACIGGSASEGLKILIPKWEGIGARQRKEEQHWTQSLDPQAFMNGVFKRQFLFGIEHIDQVTLNIETGVLDCWKCGSPTRIVTWLAGRVGPHEIRESLKLADAEPSLVQSIQEIVADRNDIGTIQERYSKTIQGSYVSNGCSRCGALIGRFFEHDAYYCEEETVGTIDWRLDAEAKAIVGHDKKRWGVWEHDAE